MDPFLNCLIKVCLYLARMYILLYTGTERMHVFCIKGIPQPPVSLMYQTAFAMVAYYHHMYLWYMSMT